MVIILFRDLFYKPFGQKEEYKANLFGCAFGGNVTEEKSVVGHPVMEAEEEIY